MAVANCTISMVSTSLRYRTTPRRSTSTHSTPSPTTTEGASTVTLGQHQRAVEDFNVAIRLDPQYAWAYYGRGVAYDNLGQKGAQELADRDFAKAKELGYNP